MTAPPRKIHPFIAYLEKLKDDRAAMAALRRGLGKPAGYVPEMFPYVVPFIPADVHGWRENTYYIVASLFGFYHDRVTNNGNLGNHYAALRAKAVDNTAVERRFTNLLSAHPEELDFHLRQAIGLLKSKEVAVNWNQLFTDVSRWNHPDSRVWVQKAWARAFWQQ